MSCRLTWCNEFFKKKLWVLDAKRRRFRAFWSVTLDLSSLLLSYDSRKREKLPFHGTLTTWRPRFARVSCKVLRSSVQSMRWCRWYWRCFLSPISDPKMIKSTAVLSVFHCSDVFSVWLLDVAWQFQLCLWQIPAGFPVKSVKLNLAVDVCTKKGPVFLVLRFNSKDRWSNFYTSCCTPRHQQCCILFGFEW